MASCFDPTLGGKDSIGWCATCDPIAKRGQRGYCGPGETKREEEAPIIYANSTNWGFCETKCHYGSRDETWMQARQHFLLIRHLKIQTSLLFFHTTAKKLRNITGILDYSKGLTGMVFWSNWQLKKHLP